MEIAYIPSGKQVYAKGDEVPAPPALFRPLPPTLWPTNALVWQASCGPCLTEIILSDFAISLSLSHILYFFLALQAPSTSIFASWPTHKTFLLSPLILVNALPLNYLRAIIVLCTCHRRGHEVVGREVREVEQRQPATKFRFYLQPILVLEFSLAKCKSIKIVECCVHILYL